MVNTSIDAERGTARGGSIPLEHVIAEYEDAPSACTIYPRDCSDADLTTHWITAEEGSFVALSETR